MYVCQVDETLYGMSNLSALSGNMKTAMVGMFDDLLIKSQLKTFNALGRGLIYRYVGDSSGEKMEITFTDEELGELL